MHIALVTAHANPLDPPDLAGCPGMHGAVSQSAQHLAAGGHRVTVYARATDPARPERVELTPGSQIVNLRAGPARPLPDTELDRHLPAFAARLRDELSAARPDVAHSHSWRSGHALVAAAADTRTPTVHSFHDLGHVADRHRVTTRTSPLHRIATERAVARTADHLVASCTDQAAELRRLGGRGDRATVVPLGVDPQLFSPRGKIGPERTTRRRVVAVGPLVERKGLSDVVRAVAALGDTELLVAGEQAGGGESERLAQLASGAGAQDRVHLLGPLERPELAALLRSADVVVCYPWYEPFGLVALEAMSCGVPVVAASVGGLCDTVEHGRTGWLVAPRQPAVLSGALRAVLADEVLRRRVGAAARAHVLQRYTWRSVANRLTEVYGAVVGGVHPHAKVAPDGPGDWPAPTAAQR